MFPTFNIKVHHGGILKTCPAVEYVGGQLHEFHDIDPDYLSYFDMVAMMNDETKKCGFSNVDVMYYSCLGQVMMKIDGDEDVTAMAQHALTIGEVDVYIVHVVMETQLICIEEEIAHVQTFSGLDSSTDEEWLINRRKLKEPINEEQDLAIVEYDSSDGEKSGSSDEYYESKSDFSDEELVRERKKKTKVYVNTHMSTDFSKWEWHLGMKFASAETFKETVTRYAVDLGYCISWCRNDHMNKLEAKCLYGCSWRIYASWDGKKESFIVKTLNDVHTCSREDYKSIQVKPSFLAKEFVAHYKRDPHWKSKYLKKLVKEKYGVHLSKFQCCRVKHAAHKILYGSLEEHYMALGSYINELKRVDSRTTIVLLTDENSIPKSPDIFKRMYVGFHGLREGFARGCRPILCLDGCFLKTFLGGMLLSAIGRDGNNQMFPVAWAVVEAENNSSWSWFLETLRNDIPGFGGEECTIISDQQKGIVNAVREQFPLVEHRNCARHIYINWSKKHKGEGLRHAFWKAARAYTNADFDRALEEMSVLSAKAVEDFISQGPKNFCRSKVRTMSKTEVIVSNIAETFNGYIMQARFEPLIEMMEGIRMLVMERIFTNRVKWNDNIDSVCPRIRKILNKETKLARNCDVTRADTFEFQVVHGTDLLSVNLVERTCTCRVWDLSGVPCCHAIACTNRLKLPIDNYVLDWFKKDKYALAYGCSIKAVNGQQHWKQVAHPLLPPQIKTGVGRPKKNRRKDPRERVDKPGKLTRHGISMTCQNCKSTGHNKRTCPTRGSVSTLNPTNQPVRPRGRPKKDNNSQQRPSRPRGRPRKGSNPIMSMSERLPSGMGVYFDPKSSDIHINPRQLGACVITTTQDAPFVSPSQP